MDEKKFNETETKYQELKEKHQNHEISTEQMKEELKRLMVQDDDGTYWMLGGKTGKWYKHDGSQWRKSDPFEEIAAAVEVLTEPMVEEESPAAEESVFPGEEVFSAEEQEAVSPVERELFPSDEREPVSSEGELFPSDEIEPVSSEEELFPSDEIEPVSSEEELFPSDEREPVSSEGELPPSDEKEPVSSEGEFFSSGEAEVKSDADGDEDGVLLLDTKKYATPEGEVQKEKVEEKEEKYEGYEEKAIVVDIDAGDKVDTGEYIRCSVCESDNPATSEVCIFCGANLKETEQKEIETIEDTAKTKTHKRKKVKEKKKKREKEEPGEEEELLVKSIKYTSFIFFLGGLGLFLGVLFGAAFGVFKPFLLKWSYELPLMLQEVRGGAAGGLIFAAVGGIGGFIVSAILSVILAAIYNFIAFIFGGIRFKVKR